MTKNTQQSAYTLPDSAKSKMRDLIGRNEGPVPHPYLDKKGIITIGVGFNVGSLDGSPKLVEAAKKSDAAAIARESHVVANKMTNDKGEVTRHERNWEAVMRNHCGAVGLEAGSDACWRSVAAEYKDKPEEQRKLETFHPSMQKILDEPKKPEEAKQQEPQPQEPQPTEPPQEAQQLEKQAELGADGQAFLERIGQPNSRPALEIAAKEPRDWTKDEANTVIQYYQRYPRPEPLNAWLRNQTSEHFKLLYGEKVMRQGLDGRMHPSDPGVLFATQNKPAANPDTSAMQKALEQLGGKLAPAFDADGMANATKSMQQGLNLLNQDKIPGLKTDGDWGPITDFSFKKSVASHGIAKIDEGFALGRLQTLAEKPQVPEDLAKQTQGILGPLYGSQEKGDDHALALQAGLNEIGPKHVDDWQPLKLDGEIGPKTTDAFNQVSNAAGPMSFAQDMGSWLGWL